MDTTCSKSDFIFDLFFAQHQLIIILRHEFLYFFFFFPLQLSWLIYTPCFVVLMLSTWQACLLPSSMFRPNPAKLHVVVWGCSITRSQGNA